jgi:SAM-dependent methyltransferase
MRPSRSYAGRSRSGGLCAGANRAALECGTLVFVRDPLAGSSWSAPATVESFVRSPPNSTLLAYATGGRWRTSRGRAIDIGCGAARNAVPLAQAGWQVLGTDLSRPMVNAAAVRVRAEGLADRVTLALAPMDRLPVPNRAFDLIVAHGIWNLARSGAEFRRAVAEAARVAAPGAGLFVFTFSRHTLPPEAQPVAGEAIVFTQFSGQPQCFVTRDQLVDLLGAEGFVLDSALPFVEHNRRPAGGLGAGTPVIFEAAFRFAPAAARRSRPSPGPDVQTGP